MATPERMGVGWLLWVFGWALLVGGVLVVLPLFLAVGTKVALWAGGAVSVLSLLLTWLAAEAARVVNADAEGAAEASLPEHTVSRETGA